MTSRVLQPAAAALLFIACAAPATGVARAAAQHHTTSAPSAASRLAGSTIYDRALSDYKHGKLARAAAEFQLAIKDHVNVFKAYVGLGTTQLYRHLYADAFQAFRAAYAMEPADILLAYQAAFAALYAGQGYYSAAIEYATIYIHHRPNDVTGYHLRFQAYDQNDNPKQQLPDARMEVKLKPHVAQSYNDLGIAFANNRMLKQSIQMFSIAIKMQPGNPMFWMNRGVSENLNKQPLLALRDLEQARKMTKDAVVRKKLDIVIAQLKRITHR